MQRKGGLRRHERLEQTVPVQVTWKDRSGVETYASGQCIDISESGMRVALPVRIAEHTYVTFRADKLPLNGSASVRTCSGRGARYVIGLEFSGGLKWRPKPSKSEA